MAVVGHEDTNKTTESLVYMSAPPIYLPTDPKPSYHPVFDRFQYVKTGGNQKWVVGRSGVRLICSGCSGSRVLPQIHHDFFLLVLNTIYALTFNQFTNHLAFT